MRVLLVGDYPPPAGGISTHVQQLHRLLGRQGRESRVLDIGKGRATGEAGVVSGRKPWLYLMRLAESAALGDLIHLHTSGNNRRSWEVAASCAWMLPRRSPRVLTVHSGLMPAAVRSDRRLRLTARAALRGFDAVVAVSPPVEEALRALGVPAGRIRVLPAFLASGVVPGALPSRFSEARARRKVLLAMAHHPSPVYGRDLMFSALPALEAKVPGLGLCLFGPGISDPAFEAAARAAGVSHLLEPLGELEHGAVIAVLGACDLFVRPTSADGDAISVREALAVGAPTVASDVAPRPSGVTIYRSGDREELVRAVITALHAEKSGRKDSEDAQDTGAALLRLYDELS